MRKTNCNRIVEMNRKLKIISKIKQAEIEKEKRIEALEKENKWLKKKLEKEAFIHKRLKNEYFELEEKCINLLIEIERSENMKEVCTDDRFNIIEKAKEELINSTNITTSPEEMNVIDSFLFRCWQMGWLDKYV